MSTQPRRVRWGAVMAAAVFAATSACAGGDDSAGNTTTMPDTTAVTVPPATTATTTTTPTIVQATTATTATTTTDTTTTDTMSTDTMSTDTTTTDTMTSPEVEIGRSVDDRPIVAVRRGDPDGLTVLVIGVIHGDEDAGRSIVDELLDSPVPDGVNLWLVPSLNPDGEAMQIRHNANGVDLNRNFPTNWGPIDEPGSWQYAGPSAASEPETQAMLLLAENLQSDLTLWYHQDLYRINPATGRDGAIRRRYAELSDLPIIEVTGGIYTGTASTWSRSIATDDGVGFTVELGATLSVEEARRHADTVLTVAAEMVAGQL